MGSRINNNLIRLKSGDRRCFNIPIDCIRKTRSLIMVNSCSRVSREVYKILKSNNGRKIFT